jgi:gamma-glutamyltranspeptidase/glutathione hydrolase
MIDARVSRVRVAVAAPNDHAADAGRLAAGAGGNAVDAALAAMLVALVSEPGVAALGGGAFVTVAPVGEPAVTVDGTVAMPGLGLPPEAFGRGVDTVGMEYGGGTRTEVGHGSVGTPGALAAFELAHARFGRMPWREVVAPAAHRARDGFPLGAAAARYLEFARGPIYDRDPGVYRALRDAAGVPLRAGDTMRLPELGDFLDRVAAEGAGALLRGDVAAALVADMAAHGGLLTAADLAAYRPEVRPALTLRVRDWELATNPPPAVGGPVLAAMLLLLEEAYDAASGVEIGALVEVQRSVLQHRVSTLEPATDRDAAVTAMLDAIAGAGPAWNRSPSTAHVSAVDDAGGACAITASSGYGSGVVAPGTGVWLNNCLGEHELNRGGLHALPPGTRLVSNMTPTVGRRADGAVLAIGSPGADRIATAVLQTLLPLVCGGTTLTAAIEAPRLHVACDDEGTAVRVEYESNLDPQAAAAPAGQSHPAGIADDLPWREHPPLSMFFGGVAAAMLDGVELVAAADPRREGAVAVSE